MRRKSQHERHTSSAGWRTYLGAVCGAWCHAVDGHRHGFGLFLQPMSAPGWGRETFALAMAVRPDVGCDAAVRGMLADKFGTAKVVVAGALLYVLGR